MWGFISKAIGSAGFKKSSTEQGRASLESSDDETCSNDSSEEGMECPICWESFNIVENVPYVLWCGHTLCKNCLLGLQLASFEVADQKVRIPFFISCPWCHLLTLRLLYKGNLKFPSKNYFILWMLENLNNDRMKSASFAAEDHQVGCSSRSTASTGSHSASINTRRPLCLGQSGSNNNGRNGITRFLGLERPRNFPKPLDFFIRLILKMFFIILLLAIVLFAIPCSFVILAVYLLVTVLFAVPSFLVLYFAYPVLDWLTREFAM
ncbi:hypothetical protein ACET3Z_007256 [Daucus carota]